MANNLNLHANINKFWPVLAVAAAAVGAAAVYQSMPPKPMPPNAIDDKMKSIVVPAPLIGSLSPARDLRGTWVSSLSKKGMQVYGKFTTGPAITTVNENGDMELVIDSVKNGIASGKIRYVNMCATAVATAPKIPPITTSNCYPDTGYRPITIRVSSSALDFGTVTTAGVTYAMRGTYTTDIMSGSMSVKMPGYGELKGEFHLMRKAK